MNDLLTLRPNFKSSEQPPHSKPSVGADGDDDVDTNRDVPIDGVELIGDLRRMRPRAAADDDDG